MEYYPSSGSSSSRDCVGNSVGMELVTIVGVHQDDFPNYYYTLRFNATKREKQTDRYVRYVTLFSFYFVFIFKQSQLLYLCGEIQTIKKKIPVLL